MSSNIKAVVLGLCNPGKEYAQTWHSIGAACIEAFLAKDDIKMKTTGYYAFAEHNDIVFAYSRSVYMNDTGKLYLMLQQKYHIEPKQLIVAHDEVMLQHGVIKCTFGGSAKGHNGLRSIIGLTGTDFYRIKIGVGHPGKGTAGMGVGMSTGMRTAGGNTDLGKYLLSPVKSNLWNLCINNFIKDITWDRFSGINKETKNKEEKIHI